MNIVSKGLKVFFLTLVVSVISFFVVVSFNTIKIGLFSEDIGYDVRGQKGEEGELEELFKYYVKDGVDTDAEKYEDYYAVLKSPIISKDKDKEDSQAKVIGYQVCGKKTADDDFEVLYEYYNVAGAEKLAEEYTKDGYELRKYSFRSDVDGGAEVLLSIISQIACLFILIAFIYNELWKIGNKDFENERLHNMPVNKLKGLYIGLIGILPIAVFLIFALVTKNGAMANLPIAIFTFTNAYAYEIIFAVTNGAMYWADVQLWQGVIYFAILAIVPVIALVSYIIGVKDISLAEKFVYKNSKKKRRVKY